jgi:hypothetical protein
MINLKVLDNIVKRFITTKYGTSNINSKSHIVFKNWRDLYGKKALWAWICEKIIKVFKLPVIDISEKWYHKILLYTITGKSDNDITLYEFIFPHYVQIIDITAQPITPVEYIKLDFIVNKETTNEKDSKI